MAKKKSKSTKSVNVDAVKREVNKIVKENEAKSPNKTFSPDGKRYGELSPGSVRRESALEQEMGTSKYRQMIHDHNSKNSHILDRLPFTFPKKKVVRSSQTVCLQCPNCDSPLSGSEFTVGIVCPKCRKYVSVHNPEALQMGYDPDNNIGFRGTLSDKLDNREKSKV